jgi:hypothetical protein
MIRITNDSSRSDNCTKYQVSGIEIQTKIIFQKKEFCLYKKGLIISCKPKVKSVRGDFIY